MIGVYLEAPEKERFRAQAAAQGRTMAGHARHLLLKCLRGELVEGIGPMGGGGLTAKGAKEEAGEDEGRKRI